MNLAISISKLIAGILAIISSIFDLASHTASAIPSWIFLILGGFLVTGSLLDFISIHKNAVRTHKFLYQSEKFFNFFANWYSQPGILSIICDDLDWITDGKHMVAYQQLLVKSQQHKLNLLLGRGFSSSIATELQCNGANVIHAPLNIINSYTFSCLSVMGDAAGKIIMRDKHQKTFANPEIIIFQEISNTYVTELLNALLITGSHCP